MIGKRLHSSTKSLWCHSQCRWCSLLCRGDSECLGRPQLHLSLCWLRTPKESEVSKWVIGKRLHSSTKSLWCHSQCRWCRRLCRGDSVCLGRPQLHLSLCWLRTPMESEVSKWATGKRLHSSTKSLWCHSQCRWCRRLCRGDSVCLGRPQLHLSLCWLRTPKESEVSKWATGKRLHSSTKSLLCHIQCRWCSLFCRGDSVCLGRPQLHLSLCWLRTPKESEVSKWATGKRLHSSTKSLLCHSQCRWCRRLCRGDSVCLGRPQLHLSLCWLRTPKESEVSKWATGKRLHSSTKSLWCHSQCRWCSSALQRRQCVSWQATTAPVPVLAPYPEGI
jgi:hypothetical protein